MTLQELRAALRMWEAAEAAVSKNKSYSIDGISYTRQDLSAIRDQQAAYRKRIAALVALKRGGSSATFRPSVCLDRWPASWTRFRG